MFVLTQLVVALPYAHGPPIVSEVNAYPKVDEIVVDKFLIKTVNTISNQPYL
ncbi:hypothetical protein MuYL_4874 [Mucilaginibacter xinganensis]|uniref:Uncharacterized protein n=1 Tax=Mucilaginibacter xinganensis TaxID=1234841 RepID=A0A223P3R6_9SPHI|nr:hypothetical protein MuYL_4874 [Mucilaginibacter xinganensis]